MGKFKESIDFIPNDKKITRMLSNRYIAVISDIRLQRK